MVNTLRKKKDKESPAVVDSNGSVSIGNGPTSGQASMSATSPAVLQTPIQAEEKNRIVPAPLKVSFHTLVGPRRHKKDVLVNFPLFLLGCSHMPYRNRSESV